MVFMLDVCHVHPQISAFDSLSVSVVAKFQFSRIWYLSLQSCCFFMAFAFLQLFPMFCVFFFSCPQSESPAPAAMAADSASVYCVADEPIYCDKCEMLLNGATQFEDHKIGKKHKKNIRASTGFAEEKMAKDKAIVIPKGTALLIEQSALIDDAVASYMRNLSLRAMLRSKL